MNNIAGLVLAMLLSSVVLGQGYDPEEDTPPPTSQATFAPVRGLDGPCGFVVDYDKQSGRLVLLIAQHENQRWPVQFYRDRVNDTLYVIQLSLPEKLPRPAPMDDPPNKSFTLLITFNRDTAEYFVTFAEDSVDVSVTTIRATNFVKLGKLRTIPDNVRLLVFTDPDSAKAAMDRMDKLAKGICLKPGFYRGFRSYIARGKNKTNLYSGYILLALRLDDNPERRRLAEEELSRYRIIDN